MYIYFCPLLLKYQGCSFADYSRNRNEGKKYEKEKTDLYCDKLTVLPVGPIIPSLPKGPVFPCWSKKKNSFTASIIQKILENLWYNGKTVHV